MKHLYTKMPFEHKSTKQKRLERDNLIKKLSGFIRCSTIEEVKDCWVSSKNLLNMLNIKIKHEEVPKFYSEYLAMQSDQLAKNEGVEINAELEAKNAQLKFENDWYSELLSDAAKDVGQLKALLKECRERLIYCTISTQDVQAKINQVLGEE